MSTQFISSPSQLALVLPKRLYKFRIWETQFHKDVLEKQVLFFSTPQKLWEVGDDMDCQFPVAFPQTHAEWMQILTAMGVKPEWKGLTEFQIFAERSKLAAYRSSTVGLKEIETHFNKDQSDRLVVLSMTGRYDNPRMWHSSYGNFGLGFCVTIDSEQCNFLSKLIGGGTCVYVPDSEPPMPFKTYSYHGANAAIEMQYQHLFMKYDRFQFEEEYRLVKKFYPQLYPHGFTLQDQCFQVPKSAYLEVTVGYLMSPKLIGEIVDVCYNQGLHVDIYEAIPYKGQVVRQWITRT